MRKLVRPSPPGWWDKFAEDGESELIELTMSVYKRDSLPSSYFRKARFFVDNRSSKLRNIFLSCSDNTCHACGLEIAVSTTPEIDHYRPKNNAGSQHKERKFPHHYFWLLYDWDNLQLLCPVCNRYKASLFPLMGKRAEVGARGDSLKGEKPLLLNSFDDDPREHYKLKLNGELSARSSRGEATIEIYQLNRKRLIVTRKRAIEQFKELIATDHVETESDVSRFLRRLPKIASTEFIGVAPMVLDLLVPSDNKQLGTAKSQDVGTGKRYTHDAAVWIKDVIVRDFGPIESMDISFPDLQSSLEPWLGIVGENGVGKSTFLKAIALALVSEEYARILVPDARTLKNTNTRRHNGYVEIVFSDQRKRRVSFGKKSRKLEFQGDDVHLPVIAFGANRITSRKGAARDLAESGAVDNLFDPVLPLVDTEKWLADTKRVSARDFSALGDNLKALMDLPATTEVTRLSGGIYFKFSNTRLSLNQMSDGFRSVIGLTAHIMKYLSDDTPVMSEAEGTVLLDELELHLHPVWKIQIVSRLRMLFPRVRFVVTTHDPLCLRGFEQNESYVFRRDPEDSEIKALALSIRPGLDIDDLLTGGWFGLGSTYDQDTEDKIHALSALSVKEDSLRLRHKTELEEPEQVEMEELKKELSRRLAGHAGSEAEKAALVRVAREAVGAGESIELDASALQARLKKAFGK